jgi:hypothetical protein
VHTFASTSFISGLNKAIGDFPINSRHLCPALVSALFGRPRELQPWSFALTTSDLHHNTAQKSSDGTFDKTSTQTWSFNPQHQDPRKQDRKALQEVHHPQEPDARG